MKGYLKWAALMLACASVATAGVVFEIETKDHGQSPEETTAWVEGKNLKMEIPSSTTGGSGTAIFRGDRREMVVVDHDDKSYMVVDGEMLAGIAGQLGQVMSQMQDALKNVPEGQRAAIEKMMKEKMPPQAKPKRPRDTIAKTGERAKHNGYPCVKYEVSRQGKKVRELWVTDWSNVEGGEEAMEAFKSMAEFFEEMLDAFGDMGNASMSSNMFVQLREIDGFPVVTREFDDDGSLESESTLRSSKRRTLDPADFEPPAGYKRRSMGGM